MRTIVAMALVATVMGVSWAAADPSTRHWAIASPSGKHVVVNLRTGAGISITGWDRDEVAVDTDWSEDRCPHATIDVSRTERGVYIESDYPDWARGGYQSCSFGLEIKVPRHSTIRINSAGGRVAVSDVVGDVVGWTGGGQLELVKLNGRVELQTGGGQIQVRDSRLDGHVQTGGGHVQFENVQGTLTGHSGSMRRPVRARQYSI